MPNNPRRPGLAYNSPYNSSWQIGGWSLCCGLLAAGALLPCPAHGQSDYLEETPGDMLGSELEPETVRDLKVSPLLVPFYTPELEFGMALGGVLTWRTDPSVEDLPRSSARVNGMYTSNEAIGFKGEFSTFWAEDTVRANLTLGGKDAADHYYGVGYDKGFDVPEGDDTTFYEYDSFLGQPSFLWRTFGNFFAGINGEASYMNASNVSDGMAQDPTYQAFGPEYWNVGAGLTLSYDSRDVTVNAWHGQFFEFRTTHFADELGSDHDFHRFRLEYRGYRQIQRPGRTLALKVEGEFVDGDTPWSMLPTVGGSRRLRGYGKGRFRDEAMSLALLEYRHMWGTVEGGYRRHGFAVWGGVGFIGEDLSDFSGHELPNAGIGYRIELQERMNARLDYGVGDDDDGFYFSIHEAF